MLIKADDCNPQRQRGAVFDGVSNPSLTLRVSKEAGYAVNTAPRPWYDAGMREEPLAKAFQQSPFWTCFGVGTAIGIGLFVGLPFLPCFLIILHPTGLLRTVEQRLGMCLIIYFAFMIGSPIAGVVAGVVTKLLAKHSTKGTRRTISD